MRLYYDKKKLIGSELKSDVISLDKFDYILNHKGENYLHLHNKSIIHLITPLKSFRDIIVLKENLFWSDYYLPNNIIFYDSFSKSNSYGFDGKYYCLVQIDNSLELVFFEGTNKSTYKDVSKYLLSVKDNHIIKKVENTFIDLYKFKLSEPNPIQEIVQDITQTRKISDNEFEKFRKFIELLTNPKKANNILERLKSNTLEIETSEELEPKEIFFLILYEIIHDLANSENEFIVQIDSSYPLDEFRFIVEGLLKNNNFQVELNNNYDLPSDYGITGTEVFRDFDKDLLRHQLKFGFIDAGYSDYIMFIHSISNTNEIIEVIKDLGFEYFGSEDT